MTSAYSSELYGFLHRYGLSPRDHVLDVGCGAGLASAPLVESGVRVTGVDISEPMVASAKERLPAGNWALGNAEALPFEAASFDAAISAQTFHHVDRARAIAELIRVLKPGAVVGIWWKHLANEDPVKSLRDRVARELGVLPPNRGLTGGFKEFYASALRDQQLRVVPWHATLSLENFLENERSRKTVRDASGSRATSYLQALERRLRAQFGERIAYLPLGYMQFLYMARTPR